MPLLKKEQSINCQLEKQTLELIHRIQLVTLFVLLVVETEVVLY